MKTRKNFYKKFFVSQKSLISVIKLTIAILTVLAFILLTGQGCTTQKPAACTEEAKICADGTVVVREGPNCEFQKCPELTESSCATVPIENRDSCCAEAMKDAIHIMCVGNWKYNEQTGKCGFECTEQEVGGAGIANPASVKCEEDGGTLEITNTPEGQLGYCFFDDNSVCEEWAYYRGECQKGECFKECGAVGTRSEGWYNSCTNELIKWDNCGSS